MNGALWCERFREHLRVLGYSEATAYSYGLQVRAFCGFLAERDINEPTGIRQEDVTAYRLWVHHARKTDGSPLSASTRGSKVGAVLVFLRYLAEEGFVLADPGRHVKRPRVPDSLPPEVPDEEQILTLLEQPQTSCPQGRRDRAILELLYSTALRNAELRALKLSDVDLQRLELVVRCGKGQKGRHIPLGEPAAAWLQEYLVHGRPALAGDSSDDTLFLNSRGRGLQAETLCDIVRGHAQSAGISVKVTPHVIRHACATHMLARKAGLRQLQRFLGHATAASTERYTRVEVSDLREVLERCHPRESC